MNLPKKPQNAWIIAGLVLLGGCLGSPDPSGLSVDRVTATPPSSPSTPPEPLPAPRPAAPPDRTDAEPPAAPVPITWSLKGCRTAIAGMPLPAGKLAPVLPKGFIPLTPEELLGQPDPRGNAVLMLLIQQCAEATGPDGSSATVASGDFHIPVRAPEGLDVTAQLHAVRIDPLVAGPVLRGMVGEAGARAFNGTVDFKEDGPVGSWRHVRATMDLGGSLFVVEGMPAVPVSGKERFTYAAYTALSGDRFLVWTSLVLNADFTVGEGHAELAPGWAREAVGAETYYFPYVMHTIQDHVDAKLEVRETAEG